MSGGGGGGGGGGSGGGGCLAAQRAIALQTHRCSEPRCERPAAAALRAERSRRPACSRLGPVWRVLAASTGLIECRRLSRGRMHAPEQAPCRGPRRPAVAARLYVHFDPLAASSPQTGPSITVRRPQQPLERSRADRGVGSNEDSLPPTTRRAGQQHQRARPSSGAGLAAVAAARAAAPPRPGGGGGGGAQRVQRCAVAAARRAGGRGSSSRAAAACR